MATADHLSVASRNLALDAAIDVLNNGYLRIYSGTQPANADTALSGNTLLAELRFGATAFAASSGGTKTANSITGTTSAAASGTATFYRCLKSDGTTAVLDGSVGTSGANLNLNAVVISAGASVNVTSMTVSIPA